MRCGDRFGDPIVLADWKLAAVDVRRKDPLILGRLGLQMEAEPRTACSILSPSCHHDPAEQSPAGAWGPAGPYPFSSLFSSCPGRRPFSALGSLHVVERSEENREG